MNRFHLEIAVFDAGFGSSVKIYPENPSSWTILAYVLDLFRADSDMLGTCIQTKIEKIEKFHTNTVFNFFLAVGCAEIFFWKKKSKNFKIKVGHNFSNIFNQF